MSASAFEEGLGVYWGDVEETRVTVLGGAYSYGGQQTFGVLSWVRPHCELLRKLATEFSLPRVSIRWYNVEQDVNSIHVPGLSFGVRHSE